MSLLDQRIGVVLLCLTQVTTACSGPGGNSPSRSVSEEAQRKEGTPYPDDHGSKEDHETGKEHEEGGEGIVVLSPEAASRIEIRTALVEERVLPERLLTTGQVDFDQTHLAHVSPRISGRVHRVRAKLGQRVLAGQTLAEVDSIEMGQSKAIYLQAKASRELARTSYDRSQALLADRIASEQEVLEAEAQLRETGAALRTAEETLHLFGLSQRQVNALSYEDEAASIYPLRAPFAGTIVELHATRGELVTPQRNLFTLADLSRVWIWIDIYQRDLGQVHLDDQAEARVDAFPQEVFTGRVSYLSPRVDVDTRTVQARIDLPNPEGKLRPGMFVEVGLLDPHSSEGQGTKLSGSVAIPEGAVIPDADGFIAFVETADNHFERRSLSIGRRVSGYVEVLQGIEVGTSVVVEGTFLLKSSASKDSLGGGHEH
ncbi:MAG: efflux RND transporter periplasmic adaptor subunit [Deltaproteobacteria bacterium]|nr:efflux RND transporter periplasmic adaptor subunit [Deltaproteobacteria bacterium]